MHCIFKEYKSVMLSAAYRVLGNNADAEDAVQDAFEKLLRYPDKVLSIKLEDLKGYLIVVSRNAAFNIRSRNVRLATVPLDFAEFTVSDTADGTEDAILSKLEISDFFRLPAMDDIYRDVIILLYYYDMSIEQTAEILDTTPGNIRVRLHRALRQMRLIKRDP